MRKKIIITFLSLISICLITIYIVFNYYFNEISKHNTLLVASSNIRSVGTSLESYFLTGYELSMYAQMEQNIHNYLVNTDSSAEYNLYKNANKTILSMQLSRMFLDGIVIHSPGKIPIQTTTFHSTITSEEITLANAYNGYHYWTHATNTKEEPLFHIIRALRNPTRLTEIIGYIKVAMFPSAFKSLISPPKSITDINYCLIDDDGTMLFQMDKEKFSQVSELITPELLESNKDQTFHIKLNNTTFYISYHQISKTNYYIYSIISLDKMTSYNAAILNGLTITLMVCLVICTILSFIFSIMIVRPLEKIGKHMNLVMNEDFASRVPIKGRDEISLLGKKFNLMAEKLEILYKQVYLGELKLKQSELNMLQSQINPHFLYNTLDTIYWMCQINDNRAGEMVKYLSTSMRMSLMGSKGNLIPIENEITQLNCYISIQSIRYTDIHFNINLDDSAKNTLVLKFLLQPLVENAIVHGVSKKGFGTISICIYAEEETLIYEILNEGKEIDLNEIKKLLQTATDNTRGFAIKNINDRIKLKYGEAYGLNAYLENEFTIFKVTQPLCYRKEANDLDD